MMRKHALFGSEGPKWIKQVKRQKMCPYREEEKKRRYL